MYEKILHRPLYMEIKILRRLSMSIYIHLNGSCFSPLFHSDFFHLLCDVEWVDDVLENTFDAWFRIFVYALTRFDVLKDHYWSNMRIIVYNICLYSIDPVIRHIQENESDTNNSTNKICSFKYIFIADSSVEDYANNLCGSFIRIDGRQIIWPENLEDIRWLIICPTLLTYFFLTTKLIVHLSFLQYINWRFRICSIFIIDEKRMAPCSGLFIS